MDCTYQSAAKRVIGNSDDIYARMADMSGFGKFLPPHLVKDWEATADNCHFSVDKVGRVGLCIEERTPCSCVKYGQDGSLPFDFHLWIQVKPLDDGNSAIKVTLKADLNPLAKMALAKPLQSLVDGIADGISRIS